MNSKNKIQITAPKEQTKLYGYNDYFNFFKQLYKKNKLPNTILLSGYKGIGKSTFVYHFVNYLFSLNEKNKYLEQDFTINSDNNSFHLVKNDIHPNFFLLDNILPGDSIKIDQVRNLKKYLNKTTYSKEIKIVMLDNAEQLNLNSSNSLLKALEEPSYNTFFFIVYNEAYKLSDTVKSRCVNFKVHFSFFEKKNIFKKIFQNYNLDSIFKEENLDHFLYFDTPGNFLKYSILLNDSSLNISKNYLSCISYLIDLYKNKKDTELLTFISLFIENFYNELSLKNSLNIKKYFTNKNKILYLINDMNKFHLDKKNLFFTIDRILQDEKR